MTYAFLIGHLLPLKFKCCPLYLSEGNKDQCEVQSDAIFVAEGQCG